jgi:hypothetical protein
MDEMLIEKVRQRTFLYDTKSPDYRDQHMRANRWKGLEKELEIERKFYVSSRDVRTVRLRFKTPEEREDCRNISVCKGQDFSVLVKRATVRVEEVYMYPFLTSVPSGNKY